MTKPTQKSSDCSDFLAIFERCGDRLVSLETGTIRAEFLPGMDDSKPSMHFDEPGLPDHVRDDLVKNKEIAENLLPDEIDG